MTQGSSGAGQSLLTEWLSLHTDPTYLITHPWILAAYVYPLWPLAYPLWNMLMLYWFGKYCWGSIGRQDGVAGIYCIGTNRSLGDLIFSNLFNYPSAEVMAYGASAAVMGFVLAATMIAPDYVMHLLLIGEVRLKYVAIVVILIDLVGLAENSNTGGHLGHIGGALGGVLFILYIRQGWSLHDLFKKPPTKIIPIRKR
ncbi:MAG: rhomboid family intramembrane serine protease [Saprospiraceae bacterium]|nr:rhomboid family intramembrane serine protease [Saprospiraceae bacterium]